jgi:hypothetical protein
MRQTGEFEHPKASARRAARSNPRRLRNLGRIESHLRVGARVVLREYLGALRGMGLGPVEAATTLGSAFLHALLEEARSARAELAHQLEHALRGRAASAPQRARARDRSRMARRRGEGQRRPAGRRTG